MKSTSEIVHDLASSIHNFIQDAAVEMQMSEMHGAEEVSWKTLIARMPEEDVEKMFNELSRSTDTYDAYYHSDDVCPGIPI